MKTFMSLSDLDKLADDDPAKPVVKQLLEWLIAPGDFPDHPTTPTTMATSHSWSPATRTASWTTSTCRASPKFMWEGVSIIDGFYHAVYLGAGDYGIGFVIPVDAPWIGDELREVLESLLDDPLHLTANKST